MMAGLKFNLISISIRRCFTFALVFYCTCEGNFTTVNTLQGINFATSSTTTPNITEPKTTTPSKQLEPNCNAVSPTPFISNFQFGVFLLVCIFALMCIVYLLYLKRMEVESKKCSCRMQRMCQHENPSDVSEPRYSLDPLTVSKLLAHHNATVVQRNEPNTSKASDQAVSSTKAVPNTPNADLEKEIQTWNAHKYLEYLKNEDEHVYEDPGLAVPQRKHLNNNLNLPISASHTQNQRLTSFNINETVRISPKIFQKEESNGRF